MHENGRIEIILGSMASGKSSEIIRRLSRFQAIGKETLIVNTTKDTRCPDGMIKTHNGQTLPAIKVSLLETLFEKEAYKNAYVIGCDECQFFSDLVSFADRASNQDNKILILAGLDGDYKQTKFGTLLDLIPCSEHVCKLDAYCMLCNDGTLASFTKRIVDCTEQELIGAMESYIPVCRYHLHHSK